jgi:hypothetical protein
MAAMNLSNSFYVVLWVNKTLAYRIPNSPKYFWEWTIENPSKLCFIYKYSIHLKAVLSFSILLDFNWLNSYRQFLVLHEEDLCSFMHLISCILYHGSMSLYASPGKVIWLYANLLEFHYKLDLLVSSGLGALPNKNFTWLPNWVRPSNNGNLTNHWYHNRMIPSRLRLPRLVKGRNEATLDQPMCRYDAHFSNYTCIIHPILT